MRRVINGAMALVVATGVMVSLSTAVSANPIAGGGYSSSYAGESVFTANAAGETGQMSAIFFNDGTQPWAPGTIGLLVCAADKITCNVPSNLGYKSGWYSDTVYATVTSTVAPGQNGFFIYDFTVPAGTAPGTVTTFYGDVGFIATGAELHPEGYFQVNTTPQPTFSLAISPATASVAVGTTQQFTVTGAPSGSLPTWSVIGGCGAVTSGGLFAATATNSLSQPCAVQVALGGSTASAPVTVYGQASQLGCAATPTTVVANGGDTGGTSTITVSIKDVNGNTVANASTPAVQISNSTPTIGTATPTGVVTPINGVVTVTMASTLVAGLFEVSASATGLTGCYVFVTTGVAGPPVGTTATFLPTAIAADGTSLSTLRVDVVDAAGSRDLSDSITQLTINGSAGGDICGFTGASSSGTNVTIGAFSATATVAQGRVELSVRSTTMPGSCTVSILTNNPSIAGTSATLTTQIVGAANKLAVISDDSPKPASAPGGTCTVTGTSTDPSCTRVVVEVRDFNGSRLTSDNGRTIVATLDPNSCATAAGGAANQAASTVTTAGRASFAFRSQGVYAACIVTFNSTGLSGTSATLTWTGGGADHLMCTLLPSPIANDGASQANGQVTVRDVANNILTGFNYSVVFSRTSGFSTVLLGSNQQTMVNGFANFTVRSTQTVGTDTYLPSIAQGGPVLPRAAISCQVEVRP